MEPTVSAAELAASGLPIAVCSGAHPATPIRMAWRLGPGSVVLVGRDLQELCGPTTPTPERPGPPSPPFTPIECELIVRLATAPLRVWTYERLFATVWGGANRNARPGDHSILYSAVKRLRPKLRASGVGIETVRGVGYRLTRM